ncbi:hypothetical protein [Hymenobacter sp. UYCo722]|uniref:hypothetical protein n=1 Tax=Hymenobacter sp. UYCo722 TaxID=3156335 RepID=UPI003391FDE3
MKLRLLFALPALLAAFSSPAQTFEPGLLVRSTGDTLRGEIENGFWVEAPEFIRFRPTPDSPSQLFQPRQLRAVSFTGGRYFRYEALPINHAAEVQLSRLPHGYTTDMRTDSLLAEVLLEGPARLFRTSYEGITHYLIRRADQPYLELSERKYLRTTATGSREVVNGNNYQSQLELYFGDCPAARMAAAKAPFTMQGVAAVVQAYNQMCAPTAPLSRSWLAQATPRRRLALQGGLLAGLRYNNFRNGYATLPETMACTDCQPRPFAGLYADLLQPGRTSALYGELSLSRFSNQNYEYYQLNSYISYYVVDYNAWLMSARLGLRFFFPLPHERQWLLSLAYELNRSFAPTITSSTGGSVALTSDQLGFGLPSLLPSLGLGWRARRCTLSLDGQFYINRNGEGALTRLVGTNFVARASVAYRLGRNPDAARLAPTTR